MTAYDRLVPEGEQVPYFIYFEVPAESIDVNIHPTKTEIKFENENEIWSMVMAAVRDTVGIFNETTTLEFDTQGRPDIPVFNPDDTVAAPKVEYNPAYNPFAEERRVHNGSPFGGNANAAPFGGEASAQQEGGSTDGSPLHEGQDTFLQGSSLGGSSLHGSLLQGSSLGGSSIGGSLLQGSSLQGSSLQGSTLQGSSLRGSLDEGSSLRGSSLQGTALEGSSLGLSDGITSSPSAQTDGLQSFPLPPLKEKDQHQPADLFEGESVIAEKSPAHYQYKGKYIMTAVKSGLMIVDQHRAHVRILYEQYLERLANRHVESQKALFPEALHLTPGDDVLLQKIMPELQNLGFELSPLGGGAYAVNAMPVDMEGVDVPALLHDMLTATEEQPSSVVDGINRSLALSMARHAAISYGSVLDNTEMENIVNDLFACANFNYTPDGKKILTILQQSEMERLFGV